MNNNNNTDAQKGARSATKGKKGGQNKTGGQNTTGKKKTGRKPKYEKWLLPENLILVEGWRRDGLSNEQIAANMNINVGTLYDWLNKYSELHEAYKKGDEVSTYEIENKLYKSAIGYDVEEMDIQETEYPDGTKVITKKKHRRHIPANIAAQIFILKNRRPDKWKEKPVADDTQDIKDDGFIDAIKESAKEDWNDED